MNDLIGALERLGYVVTAEDDRLSLHFTGPDAPPVDVVQPLLARLRGKKAEAIAFLKARAKERYCNAIAVGIAVPHEPKNVDSPDQTIQHCSIAPIVAPYGEKKIPGADGGDEREKAISESAPRQRTLTSAKVQYPAESLVSARADHPPMAGVSPSPSCIFPAPYTPTMGAILQCSDVFPCATKGNGELADCNTDCNGTAILATPATSPADRSEILRRAGADGWATVRVYPWMRVVGTEEGWRRFVDAAGPEKLAAALAALRIAGQDHRRI